MLCKRQNRPSIDRSPVAMRQRICPYLQMSPIAAAAAREAAAARGES
jgi:hypothetical protein